MPTRHLTTERHHSAAFDLRDQSGPEQNLGVKISIDPAILKNLLALTLQESTSCHVFRGHLATRLWRCGNQHESSQQATT